MIKIFIYNFKTYLEKNMKTTIIMIYLLHHFHLLQPEPSSTSSDFPYYHQGNMPMHTSAGHLLAFLLHLNYHHNPGIPL